jgi:hypothetical protein
MRPMRSVRVKDMKDLMVFFILLYQNKIFFRIRLIILLLFTLQYVHPTG